MFGYGPAVQMPSPPAKPNLTTSSPNLPNEIRQDPIVAQLPADEMPSGKVVEPVTRTEFGQSTVKSLPALLLPVTTPLMAGVIGVNSFFDNEVLTAWLLFIFFTLMMNIAVFKPKTQKTTIAEDGHSPKDGENLAETLEHYAKDRDRFREEAERFRVRYEVSPRMPGEYKHYLEETALYEQQLDKYETRKLAAFKTRELLWERMCFCTRCVAAYSGHG